MAGRHRVVLLESGDNACEARSLTRDALSELTNDRPSQQVGSVQFIVRRYSWQHLAAAAAAADPMSPPSCRCLSSAAAGVPELFAQFIGFCNSIIAYIIPAYSSRYDVQL